MIADDLVERAERLVHQKQRRIEGERAGDRGALLHAAGELPGKFALEAGQIDQREVALDALVALGRRHAHDFERQRHVPARSCATG